MSWFINSDTNKIVLVDEQPDKYVDLHSDTLYISRLLDILSEKERKIVELRCGFNVNHDGACGPCTLDEVGKEFGVTGTRIRQLEMKAYEKMRMSTSLPPITLNTETVTQVSRKTRSDKTTQKRLLARKLREPVYALRRMLKKRTVLFDEVPQQLLQLPHSQKVVDWHTSKRMQMLTLLRDYRKSHNLPTDDIDNLLA